MRFVRINVLFYFLLSFAFPLFGETAKTDTIQIEEVQVSANRFHQMSVGSIIIPIDTIILKTTKTLSLPDLLTASGLQINNYGPGGLSTLSVRGSSASHTAIVWDEINLQSPMNGQFNLAVIPNLMLDYAHIQFGGAGVMYGSGCMNGIVHLGNSSLLSKPNDLWISTGLGSFKNRFYAGGFKAGNSRIATSIKLFNQKADNDFPYRNTADFYQRIVKQTNAGVDQTGFIQENTLKTSSYSFLKTTCWYQQYNKQIQTMMTSSMPNTEKQNDKNLFITTNWKYIDSAFQLSIKNAVWYNYINYIDASNESKPNESTSVINEVETKIRITKNQTLNTGINQTIEKAASNGYVDDVTRWRISTFLLYKIERIFNRLHFMFGLRDEYVNYLTPIVYTIGAEYQMNRLLKLSGNFSRNYRIPTLNDMYWKEDAFARGNMHLKPENGYSSDIGFHQKIKNQNMNITFSEVIFYNKISNWIIWQPSAIDGKWEPINKQKGISKGIEIRINGVYTVNKLKLLVNGSYYYTQSNEILANGSYRRLDYVPLHKVNGTISIAYKNFSITYIHNYTGERNSLETVLKPYQVADIATSIFLPFKAIHSQLMFRVNNVWNSPYQVRKDYAMPLRNYMISLIIDFSAEKR